MEARIADLDPRRTLLLLREVGMMVRQFVRSARYPLPNRRHRICLETAVCAGRCEVWTARLQSICVSHARQIDRPDAK